MFTEVVCLVWSELLAFLRIREDANRSERRGARPRISAFSSSFLLRDSWPGGGGATARAAGRSLETAWEAPGVTSFLDSITTSANSRWPSMSGKIKFQYNNGNKCIIYFIYLQTGMIKMFTIVSINKLVTQKPQISNTKLRLYYNNLQ